MSDTSVARSPEKLASFGFGPSHLVHYQLSPRELVDDTLRRGEGELSDHGALVIHTGEFTGRSPRDKFTIKDELTASTVNWNEFNIPMEGKYFDIIFKKMTEHLRRQREVWVRDAYACADPRYRLNIRVITETPWHNLFAHNMFLRPSEQELDNFQPAWQVLVAPTLRLDPAVCGTRQHNASVISFKHKMVLIAGSGYTGEIKKSIFSVLNYVLPQEKNVLSMHCSANKGPNGDTALFFGLSGTGKTTLSADPARQLIGDDEHGWSDNNIFNFEGGCYAKCIDLCEEQEPEIFHAIRSGALVENTPFFRGTQTIDLSARDITENTRVSYPLHYIAHALAPAIGPVPCNVFFLTCDAYGILPPISRLSPQQAMYQFISGYTAKVAGTEAGITEPKATFSACFGAPFIPLHPGKYAAMLGEKLKKNNVNVWMINTGWTGGPYGTGRRMNLGYTRAMIVAALDGRLDNIPNHPHEIFGMAIPDSCPGVPSEMLDPRNTWSNSAAYDEAAQRLARLFVSNFERYAGEVAPEITAARPKFISQ